MKKNDGLSIFAETELERVQGNVYDRKYPALKARTLLPVKNEGDDYSDTITYRTYSEYGFAKIVEAYAKDFPRVNVAMVKQTVDVYTLGDSYGYSLIEMKQAQKAGKPLDQKLANAAKRAMMETENRVALLGDADHGISGFFNHPNVPVVAQSASGLWSTKNGDEIIADLRVLIDGMHTATNGAEMPDSILMSKNLHSIMSTKRMPEGNLTVLAFFKQAFPEIVNMDWVQGLETAGVGGTERIVLYRKDPEAIELDIPVDFNQILPQIEGMEFVVNCYERLAGTIIYYPLSVSYMDVVA